MPEIISPSIIVLDSTARRSYESLIPENQKPPLNYRSN
jgi:hypothetical protein